MAAKWLRRSHDHLAVVEPRPKRSRSTRLPRPALLLALAAAVAALAVFTASAAAHGDRGCGTVHLNDGASVHTRVLQGDVACWTARRTLRRYFNSTAQCAGSSCLREIGPWTCQAAGYHDFPRLASCNRPGRWIAAYSLAD